VLNAYGRVAAPPVEVQTGSGKTYTMTGHEDSVVKEHYQVGFFRMVATLEYRRTKQTACQNLANIRKGVFRFSARRLVNRSCT
jgi:hypothetical protein